MLSGQPHSLDGLLTLVLTAVQLSPMALSLVHSNGHTLVPRVGSRAKLSEGSTQRVSVCEGVNLALNLPLSLREAGVG